MREIILLIAAVFFGHAAFCLWRRRKRPKSLVGRMLLGTGAFLCSVLAITTLLTLLGFVYYYHRPRPKSTVRLLCRGVAYARDVRDTPRPAIVHILFVNLKTPGVGVVVTPSETETLPARTVSEFAQEFGVQAAINANCFEPCWTKSILSFTPRSGDAVRVLGNAASGGVAYSKGHRSSLTLSFAEDNTAVIGEDLPNAMHAISGTHRILKAGHIANGLPSDTHPRTAVALSEDRGTLLMLVVDGRQPGYSEGLTLEELASVIREHGGYDAINLDGGGSSAMVAEKAPGKKLRVLNSPVHTGIPGRQRPVANHLGIVAAPVEE